MKDLLELLPPGPRHLPQIDSWQEVESVMGTPLPSDYKTFVNLYGTGSVDNFLWVLVPHAGNSNLDLIERGRKILADSKRYRDSGGDDGLPFVYYPDPGGLLPWGITDNGDLLFWVTGAVSVDDWPVMVYSPRDGDFEVFDMNLTRFLSECLSRTLRCSVFPDAFPSETPRFEPQP